MPYQASEVKIYKETSLNVAPATPVISNIKTTSFDLSKTQASEVIKLMGNGFEPARAALGTYSVEGSVGFVQGAAYMALQAEAVIGAATTAVLAGAVRVASTAYTVGTIVRNTAGTKSFVCTKAGTSAATEPTITGLADGSKVVDGTAEFVLRPLLYTRTGQLQGYLPSFGIERKDTLVGGGTAHYERFTGLTMDSLSFKKEGGEIKFESSQNVKGIDGIDSIETPTYTALGTGTTIEDSFYSADDLTIQISTNGGTTWTTLTGLDSINLTVSRANEIKQGVSEKRAKFGDITIGGNASGLLTTTLYTLSINKALVKLRFVYDKLNGDKSIFTFNAVDFGAAKKSISENDVFIDITLSASGTTTTTSIQYECTSTLTL